MIYAGIDAGSRAIKIALIDEEKKILQTGITGQGVRQVPHSAEADGGI